MTPPAGSAPVLTAEMADTLAEEVVRDDLWPIEWAALRSLASGHTVVVPAGELERLREALESNSAAPQEPVAGTFEDCTYPRCMNNVTGKCNGVCKSALYVTPQPAPDAAAQEPRLNRYLPLGDRRQVSERTGMVKAWLCKDLAGEFYLTRDHWDACAAIEDGRYCVDLENGTLAHQPAPVAEQMPDEIEAAFARSVKEAMLFADTQPQDSPIVTLAAHIRRTNNGRTNRE